MTGGTVRQLLLAAILTIALAGVAWGQGVNCYTLDPTTGAMVWNGTCSNNPASPWEITVGKIFKVYNTLFLKGIDNQTLDLSGLPQGNLKLGTAALADTLSFQPYGSTLNLVGIDTTSTIVNGTGTKTFAVASGLGFTTGMVVTAIETANPQVYMLGSVTSYSSTTLVINSTYAQGAYTGTGWTVQISGPQGPVGATGSGSVPIGSFELWGGSSLPTNYLWASGPSYSACVLTSPYSALYAAIGDTWTTVNGCGPGSFGIPNMGGKFPLGANGTYALGSTGGATTHTQTEAELAAHNHGGTTGTESATHTHSTPWGITGPGGNTYGQATDVGGSHTSGTESATHTHSIPLDGSNSPMSIMNPYIALNYIVRYQ
jgi:microcystin-dependent protein